MAFGDIISSKHNGMPVYGNTTNAILYEDLFNVKITISWEDGNDIDILGRYEGSNIFVGWNQGGKIIKDKKWYAHWRGDNTHGGPEYVDLSVGLTTDMQTRKFDVYLNWYSLGYKDDGTPHEGGLCTVTATDGHGNEKSVTFAATKTRIRTKAEITDPGARITITSRGVVTSISKINQ